MSRERCGTCSRWMWVCEDVFGDMQGAWHRPCDEWEAARDGE